MKLRKVLAAHKFYVKTLRAIQSNCFNQRRHFHSVCDFSIFANFFVGAAITRCNGRSGGSQLQRIVIVGNSGSGKSHLARQLSSKLGLQVVHFDEHFWEPGGFKKKRLPEVVHPEIKQLSLKEMWIMEGVFGDLAATALENATAFIFLNKSWDECKSALIERGSESSKQLDASSAEKNFRERMIWAEAYTQRENSRSLKGHIQLYEDFKGPKFVFQDRQSVANFVSALAMQSGKLQ